jgi:periplasmic protein TonB
MSVRSLLPYPHPMLLEDLSPVGRQSCFAAVLLLHLLAAGAGWQAVQPSTPPRPAAIVQVDWIAPPAPVPTRPPAAVAAPRPRPPLARPVIASAASPSPVLTPPPVAPAAQDTPPPVPAPVATGPASSNPTLAAAAPPVATPVPRLIPASAVMYRVPPAQAYPLASRRLGEQGTVLLQLVVDAQGLPHSITLHRSSGHARLDEQALQAMRAARFQPHTQNGVATAWMAIAPLRYELE